MWMRVFEVFAVHSSFPDQQALITGISILPADMFML
jgi:hypothetical protein